VPFFHRGPLANWTAPTANARAEILTTSRNFRAAFERRRCLVPVDTVRAGLAARPEWDAHPTRGSWWPLAGLWDRAATAEGEVESFAIVTLDPEPSADLEIIRRPLRLNGADAVRWLDLSADVGALLRSAAMTSQSKASPASR
jgi:putative SOS response-associated peptidase YedK